jgi:hypothetical protein
LYGLFAEARKETFEHIPAAGQQSMCVDALGNALTMFSNGGKTVLVNHCNVLESIGQHTGRKQSSYASTDDYGMA